MKNPIPEKDVWCHDCGFKKTCHEMVTQKGCQKWVSILGQDPQTGEEYNQYGCADRFIPLLLVELGRQQSHTASSVDSMRNNIARSAEATAVMITGLREQRAPNSNGHDIIPDAIDVTPPLPQIEE